MNKIYVLLAAVALAGCSNNADRKYASAEHPLFVTEASENFNNQEETSSSQLYSVVAARATNKMLDQTTSVYDKPDCPKLYIEQIKKSGARHVPDGFYYSRQVTQEIIKGSKTYELVNSQDKADYILEISITRLGLPDTLQYKMVLVDKKGEEVGVWRESIRQISNDDRSWW